MTLNTSEKRIASWALFWVLDPSALWEGPRPLVGHHEQQAMNALLASLGNSESSKGEPILSIELYQDEVTLLRIAVRPFCETMWRYQEFENVIGFDSSVGIAFIERLG